MSKSMDIPQIREEIDYIKTEVKYADIYRQGEVIDDNFILVQNVLFQILSRIEKIESILEDNNLFILS